KTSYPDRKKTSTPDRKKISYPDRKKTSYPISNTNLSNTNSSNTNLSNINLSNVHKATETEIQKLDLPIAIQKQMILNKDRLIDDNISLDEIVLIYKAYSDRLNEFQFAQVLG